MTDRKKLLTVTKGNKLYLSRNANYFDTAGRIEKLALADYNNALFSTKDDFAKGIYANVKNKEDIMNAYKNSTNSLGISKANNPFSKININLTIGALSPVAGAIGGNLISGGLQSTAGNLVSSIGGTVGGIMSAIPGIGTLAGGIVSGASGLLGGLTNAMFGSKLNKENIAKVEGNINNTTNAATAMGSAASSDELNNLSFVNDFDQSYIGKDGWFSNKAKNKFRELQAKRDQANNYMLHGFTTGAINLDNNIDDIALAHSAAFGGYLDDIDPTTPIGYSMLTDKLTNDNNKNNNKNMTNIFARTPNMFAMGSPLFAFGGNVETHGGTYSTDLTHIDTGGSHEENPNQGVLMGVDHQGTPNLVEEGEVIYDDYVFSDRLTVPEISKKKDLSYNEKVLKKYSGKTYADAAKKAEKESGVDERPNDEVSRKTFEAILEVLAQSQEKEREMDKLRQMQEAIKQMTPEEFTMMQQQLAEQEAQLQQLQQAEEAAMMQQQQMQQPRQVQLQEIPQGMEYMLQPIEELLPIAALGGLLNIPNNMYASGGNLAKFKEDLEKIGLTLEDYYIASLGSSENSMLEEANRDIFRKNPDLINDSNFDKNYAEKYLNRAKRIEKRYRDRAKKIGINYDNLSDIEKATINKDIAKAITNSFSNDNYKLGNDDSLFINSLAAQSATSQKEVRLNLRNSSLNDYMDTQGSRTVTVGENGKLPWNTSVNGLVRSQYRLPKLDENGNHALSEAGERLYNDYQDVNDDYFNNGYYKEDADNRFNYNAGVKSSIDDADNVTLYGWKLNDDGLWVKDESAIYNKDSENVKKGKTANHFEPWTNLTKEQIILLLEQLDYKDQTKAVSDAIEAANGNFDNLDPKILNYLKFLDSKTGTILKLLGADGKTLSDDTATLYRHRRTDNLYGPYHYGFDIGSNGTADRYFYKKGDLRIYVDKPDDSWGYTIKDPVKVTIGDTDFNDYEIEGITGNRVYAQMPDGTIKDVTNVAGVDKWKDAEAPYEDDESPLGFTGTTRWVLLPEDYIKLSTEKNGNDKFPTPSNWPYWLAGAAQLGTLGYNIFKKPDYSRAEALIKAAKEIGKPQLIQFRPIGNLLEYRPMDVLSELNRQNAIARSTDRYITNNAMPISSQIAGLIANGYNSQLASGQLFENALKYNDKRSLEVAEYNKDTAKFNSEGFLKADMANQDAANRAKIYSLEGLKSGYTMEQAIADARSNAINAGISGLANLGLSYALNKWNNNLYKYAIDKGAFAGVHAAKGGKLRKKNKGLNF